MKTIINILNFFHRFGFRGIWSLFFPVYWTQDIQFRNHGFDIISLKRPKNHYFKGTYSQQLKEFY